MPDRAMPHRLLPPQSAPAGPSGLAGVAAQRRVVVVASPGPDAVRMETCAQDRALSSETATPETALSVSSALVYMEAERYAWW